MKKKYGTKLAESLKKGARSSVGRAPQWHPEVPPQKSSSRDLLKFPKDAQIVEIPTGWEPVSAMRYEDGEPVLYRVLIKTDRKRFENDLNGKRRRKLALGCA